MWIARLQHSMHQPEIKRFGVPALFVAIFLASAGLRVDILSKVEVKQFPDTASYTKKASWPLWGGDGRLGPFGALKNWWLDGRSPTVPFFYKLAGNTSHSIAVFQVCFSILCWGLLALLVARAVQFAWLKPFAFLIVLMFSLSAHIIMWDGIILSDSISFSLMALVIANFFWLLESWHWRKAVLVLVVGLLWAFSRDTNAWLILMLGCSLIIVAALRWSRHYLLIGAAFVMIFGANEISQNYSQRWVMPFINVVGRRILPNPEWTAYFAGLGMPVTPALMRLSGQLAWHQDRAFYKDPALQDFRDWVSSRGKSSYTRFLLSHPAMTLQEPLRNIGALIVPKLDYYGADDAPPILGGAVAEAIYFEKWPMLWGWASGIIFGCASVIAARTRQPRWLMPLLMVALAYPHAALAWHGDANDVGRHALQAGVHFQLGLWILLLFAADMVFANKFRQRAQRLIQIQPGAASV